MIKESTKALWKVNGGWRHPILFLHGYIYLAYTATYVDILLYFNKALSTFGKYMPKRMAAFYLDFMIPYYHGKVVRSDDAKKIVSLDKDLRVDDSIAEKIIPFETVRQIILENPDSVVTIDCACRLHAKKATGTCCSSAKYGTNVCMAIGEPQASFCLEHSNLNPKRLSVNEAIDRLEDIHKNGWVHTVYYKNALGNRTYAICNCCKCCCAAIHANSKMIPMLGYSKNAITPSGYVAKIDTEKCKGCLTCVKWCPFDARRINPSTKKSEVIYEKCYGCGVCVDKCPNGAVSLIKDINRGGEPLDIEKIQKEQAQLVV